MITPRLFLHRNGFTHIALFLLLLSCAVRLTAQDIEARAKTMAAGAPGEVIHIHFDKENYVAGETVWFKSYVYGQNMPAASSSNLYLQLINSKGNFICNNKYPISGATASGHIDLPDSLPQDYYTLIAFTTNQLNYPRQFLYKKSLLIFSAAAPMMPQVAENGGYPINVRFFPESGKLIENIITEIAFTVTDQLNEPVEVSGAVKNSAGQTMCSLGNTTNGIGHFRIKPAAGEQYYAIVNYAGKEMRFTLPEVSKTGINLKVENEPGGKVFTLTPALGNPPEMQEIRLVAQIGGQVIYDQSVAFENYPSIRGHLVLTEIPAGILQMIVFDKNGTLVAERLTLVQGSAAQTGVEIRTPELSAEKHGKNTWEVIFPDEIQRSLSIAVTDLDATVPMNSMDHIASRLLLAAELQGDIINPSGNFDGSAAIPAHSERLLITMKSNRYNWERKDQGVTVAGQYKDPRLLQVSGTLFTKDGNKPVKGGTLQLLIIGADMTPRTFNVEVETGGKFFQDSIMTEGIANVEYSYKDAGGKIKNVVVQLDTDSISEKVKMIPAETGALSSSGRIWNKPLNSTLQKRFAVFAARAPAAQPAQPAQPEERGKTRSRLQETNEKYCTSNFKGQSLQMIDLENNPNNNPSISVLEYIRENLRHMEFQNGALVYTKRMGIGRDARPFPVELFLNEANTTASNLHSIRIDQVALIKLFDLGLFPGISGSIAVVAVYMKKGLEVQTVAKPLTANEQQFKLNGYNTRKEFYMPDYSTKTEKRSSDDRITLYWNGDIVTNSKKIEVVFNNNDHAKRYKIIVEGFDASGKLIHVEKIIGN